MLHPLHALIALAHARGACDSRDTRRTAVAPSCVTPPQSASQVGRDAAASRDRICQSRRIASNRVESRRLERYQRSTRLLATSLLAIHPVYLGRARITPWGGSAHRARKKAEPPRACVSPLSACARVSMYVEECVKHPLPSPLDACSPRNHYRRLVAKSTVSLDARRKPPSIDENARATFTYVLRKFTREDRRDSPRSSESLLFPRSGLEIAPIALVT